MNIERLKQVYGMNSQGILDIRPGQQLYIHEKVGEDKNQRIWRFKGLVIKVSKPNHADGSFTIRGKSSGITIEKVYPLSYPNFDKVELLDEYKIRRAKLYYIREKVGKDARMKSIIDQKLKDTNLLDSLKKFVVKKDEANA